MTSQDPLIIQVFRNFSRCITYYKIWLQLDLTGLLNFFQYFQISWLPRPGKCKTYDYTTLKVFPDQMKPSKNRYIDMHFLTYAHKDCNNLHNECMILRVKTWPNGEREGSFKCVVPKHLFCTFTLEVAMAICNLHVLKSCHQLRTLMQACMLYQFYYQSQLQPVSIQNDFFTKKTRNFKTLRSKTV